MLQMSSYKRTLDKAKLIQAVQRTKKLILHTSEPYDPNAARCNRPISKEEAVTIIQSTDWLDAAESKGTLRINTYGGSDIW